MWRRSSFCAGALLKADLLATVSVTENAMVQLTGPLACGEIDISRIMNVNGPKMEGPFLHWTCIGRTELILNIVTPKGQDPAVNLLSLL